MRLVIAALMGIIFSWPANAYLIPINSTVEIDGPWASNQLVIGQIFLSASATITPAIADGTDFNSFVEWVVFTDLSVPGANVENGAPVGALGLLEVFGANFSTHCTSCSQTATIFWNPTDPPLALHTITTSTTELNFGIGVSNLQASLDLELPDGFSVAGVPEPSTWAMLLIGFAGISFVRWWKSVTSSRIESRAGNRAIGYRRP